MITPQPPARSGRLTGARPDVSVITTVLDCALYLRESIESVLAQQTTATWELLIVDDGSTDGSFEIAREFTLNYPGQICLLHHLGRRNRGISASRNLALLHARAPNIAFLDADDVWLQGRLETQLPLLTRHPDVAMIYAQAERWLDFAIPFNPSAASPSAGRNFVPALIPHGQGSGVIGPPTVLDWFLSDESMTPCTCTVLVRTDVARRVGGFDSHFRGLYDDQVFYAKVALEERIFVSLQCVARYRQHKASCCAVARTTSTEEKARDKFLAWLDAYRMTRRVAVPLLRESLVQV